MRIKFFPFQGSQYMEINEPHIKIAVLIDKYGDNVGKYGYLENPKKFFKNENTDDDFMHPFETFYSEQYFKNKGILDMVQEDNLRSSNIYEWCYLPTLKASTEYVPDNNGDLIISESGVPKFQRIKGLFCIVK